MALHLPLEIIELKIAITRELLAAQHAPPQLVIDLNLWEKRGDTLAEFIARISPIAANTPEFEQLLNLCYQSYSLIEDKSKKPKRQASLKHKTCFVLQVAANYYATTGNALKSQGYSRKICELLGPDQLTALASRKSEAVLYLAGAHLSLRNYPLLL